MRRESCLAPTPCDDLRVLSGPSLFTELNNPDARLRASVERAKYRETSALRRLRSYKTGEATYDDGRNELRDEIPPDSFVQEHLRRLREEERVSCDAVRSRLKL